MREKTTYSKKRVEDINEGKFYQSFRYVSRLKKGSTDIDYPKHVVIVDTLLLFRGI